MATLQPIRLRPGLFIGSTSHQVRSIGQAMQWFLSPTIHGRFAIPALPHGETTDSHWVDEQLQRFDNISALRCVKRSKFGTTEKYYHLPRYVVREDQEVNVDEIDLLLYRRASAAFPVFQRICNDYKIRDQRLQIGINTIDLLLFGLWWQGPGQLDAFIERTRQETERIWKLTGGKVFFLIESPTATILANLTRCKPALLQWYVNAFAKLIENLPKGAGWGFHFCNGRLGGDALGDQGILKRLGLRKLIYKPQRTVQMSNHVLGGLAELGLVPELVQYPLVFGSRPPSLKPADYEPYRALVLPPGVQAYAGAISPKLTLRQQTDLFHLLDDVFGQRIGMSATCGYGSDDLHTMLASINMMSDIAAM